VTGQLRVLKLFPVEQHSVVTFTVVTIILHLDNNWAVYYYKLVCKLVSTVKLQLVLIILFTNI